MNSKKQQIIIAAILGFMIGAAIVLYKETGTDFLQNKIISFGFAATIFGLILLLFKSIRKS